MDPSRLKTRSLETLPWGMQVGRILAAALEAVNPYNAVQDHLSRSGDILQVADRAYNLASFNSIYLIGAGKAGAPMAHAVADLLADRLNAGIIVTKEGYEKASNLATLSGIDIISAGHPLPDHRGVQATQRICELLDKTGEQDLVICLISGGGSALLTNPAPGISLEDLRALTEVLLACGAGITEINTMRKHLEQIKGGNLARRASPAQLITLVLSDVVGNPLDIIASGPTVADPSTFGDTLEILQRYQLRDKIPGSIYDYLHRGAQGDKPETPKPGDVLFERVQNLIVGSNIQAAEAAVLQAQSEGFHTMLLTTYLQGEACQAGRVLAAIARQIDANDQPISRPACVVVGGETTVTLRGEGLGGRNQELALSAVEGLANLPQVALITLATDGGDGPTDAAGAVVTGETLLRAQRLGMNPVDYLAQNDAYHFFAPLGDLLHTGPTQTNVNDLALLFLQQI